MSESMQYATSFMDCCSFGVVSNATLERSFAGASYKLQPADQLFLAQLQAKLSRLCAG